MRELYDQVNQLCRSLDFDLLCPGFHPYPFVIYDENTVYLSQGQTMPRDNRFLGNSVIRLDGELTAIFFAGPDADPNELASGIVHEMFHAYQRECEDNRWSEDLPMMRRPNDLYFYELKYLEHQFLTHAFATQDEEEKKHLFNQFATCRRERLTEFPDFTQNELKMETMEGGAEFIGCKALSILDPEKYEEKIRVYIEKINGLNASFFDARRMCYFTGTLLLILADELGIDFDHNLKGQERSNFELIASDLPVVEIPPARSSERIRETLDLFEEQLEDEMEELLNKTDGWKEIKASICGYDPMNMVRLGDIFLCRHFVMLSPDGEKRDLYKGPTLLKMQRDSDREVEAIATIPPTEEKEVADGEA